MTRHDEQADERLRTEDLVHAGGTEPAEQDEFRPSNDDFRSTEDEQQHIPVAREGDRDAMDTEPVDQQEIRDADLDGMDTVDGAEPVDAGYGTEMPAEPVAATEPAPADTGDEVRQLFRPEDIERFRSEWLRVQTMFVDDPRDAVRGADHLVAEAMQSLASTFNEHKRELESHWQEGTDTQTEELRIALRSYRTFFNQLLDI